MFPYVVLIDSTYKTNKYKMPLVEFVGMTSAGKNFNIAYCFAVREDKPAYTWMLHGLGQLMTQCPDVVVTENEKALVNALRTVLPSVPHLLCRWHISRNVAAKAMKIMNRDKNAAEVVASRWARDSVRSHHRSIPPSRGPTRAVVRNEPPILRLST